VAYFSKEWKSMLGYDESDVQNLGKAFFNLIHEDDKEKTKIALENHLKDPTNNTYEIEIRLKCKDNKYKWILSRGEAIFDSKSKPLRMIGSHVDIHHHKRVTEHIKKTNTILEHIASGAPAYDIYDEIALMYESRHEGMRCSLLELHEDRLLHGGAPSMPKEYCSAVHGLKNGPNVGSCGTSTYTGKRMLVENIDTHPNWNDIKQYALPHGMRCCWSEPIINSSGKVLGAFGMYYDYPALPNDEELEDLIAAAKLASIVMERDQAQKQLLKNEKLLFEQTKMVSIGEMMGNIAHQWRQPLSVISTASSGVLMYNALGKLDNETLEKEMQYINDNVQYLSKTIDDFKNFVKGDRVIQQIYLNDIIENCMNLIKGSIKTSDITIVTDIDESIVIDTYPNELLQCFINIFNNAKDALEDIETTRYFFIGIKKEENHAIVTFKDNAGGIPDDILPKIFDQYFTTKTQSHGTGLGLSMVQTIISEGLNGTIAAQNVSYTYDDKNYTGAEFTISLPFMP
jgi:PAS domain S-box-containing protein